MNSLSVVSFAHIFSQSLGCLFISLTVSFAVQQLFILMKYHKFIFAFVSLSFGDVSWKKLLWPMLKRLLPMFSSRILMDSCLTSRAFIHLEFIFVYGERVVKFHSFPCSYPNFPAPFIVDILYIFFPLDGFFLLCQGWVAQRAEGPFLGSLFCSIGLCVCFCGSTILSLWSQLCRIAWNRATWCPHLCFSFSTLPWRFGAFSGST